MGWILGCRPTYVYSNKTKIYTIRDIVFRHRENLYEYDIKYSII